MFLSGNMPAAKEKAPAEPSDSDTSSYDEEVEEDTTAAWALAVATPKSAAAASDTPDPRNDREPAPEFAGVSPQIQGLGSADASARRQ